MSSDLRARELERFEVCGWRRIAPLATSLPIDPGEYLRGRKPAWWSHAADLSAELQRVLAPFRFAVEAEVGLLFVPAVSTLDTRKPVAVDIRRRQRPDLVPDVFDSRLGEGRDAVPENATGAFFVTAVGRYGVNAGSYHDIAGAPAGPFAIGDVDTRAGMTRQLWGARVLQAGDQFMPDTEDNERWTFTLFAGDELDAGMAGSGTVLKSKVRFRLGKPDRGIGSARVAPAILLDSVG